MFISLLFTAALLVLARAQDCPQVDLVTNFDLASYAQGTWYEIARYTNDLEKYGNCVATNYTKRGDNDYVIEVSEVQNGKRIVYDGLLDLSTDDHLKGIVNYVFLDGKSNYKMAISFLAVDYNSYAIKYSCMTDPKGKGKIELAWIFSRTKLLTDSAEAAIDSYLSSSKLLDKTKFFYDAFSDDSCKFTDSSVDRTLPKRMT
ncbi:bilin-binding protein-like [Aricia agestis]|uniref:bilin-binding protein-like n=1 Tax=Aricia agestis TaxID=91739 RepID=UPI001C202459|nr:bilin-binding protein-like [Aricia agestis]